MIVSYALAQLLHGCAPRVAPATIAAIVLYESRGNPYAIDDDTERKSYFPRTAAAASALAASLLRRGHNIDVGLAQVNVSNFAAYGLTATSAFDECKNLRAGAAILVDRYRSAVRRYPLARLALLHALCAYNSGSERGDAGYAHGVLAMAQSLTWTQQVERRGPSR
jgi:type IV secretion system protein VirB1